MSAMKRFMEEVYEEHKDGMAKEDIARKHNAPLLLVEDAIEIMEDTEYLYEDIFE